MSDFANTLTKSDSVWKNISQVVQAHQVFHAVQKKSDFVDIQSDLFNVWKIRVHDGKKRSYFAWLILTQD